MRLRSDDGFALVPALMVMFLFLMSGIVVLDLVDSQQRQSRIERERESSFQLAEGILNEQIYRLSQRWPQSNEPYEPRCAPGVADRDCPSSAVLQTAFPHVDYGNWAEVQWTTYVRDNLGAYESYFDDALLNDPTSWDSNGDKKMWVRAQATVRGEMRTVVALVEAELIPSQFVPNKTLVAGWFTNGNSGAKTIISNGDNGSVIVRCAGDSGETTVAPTTGCAEYRSTSQHGSQVEPARIYSDPDYPPGIQEEALDQLRNTADEQGNYHSTCPPSLQGDVPGEVVFIEDATGCPPYNGNHTYNTAEKMGSVVIAKGGPLVLNGGAVFYGLIYHANTDNQAGILVDLTGNTRVYGGVVIDGAGGAAVGSSGGNGPDKGGNLVHLPNAGESLQTYGTAGILQNSFRELVPDVRN